ncbi:hypothetical protein D9M71_795180 [compost metagenome]
MSRGALRAGIAALRAELVPEPCTVIIVPHDGERPACWWFASVVLAGRWCCVSVKGDAEYAAERIRDLRPRCAFVAMFSSDRPRGQVLH